MKKFLFKLLIMVSVIFFITMVFTLVLESRYKEQLTIARTVKINIENNKIVPPVESPVSIVNYNFSKGFFLISLISTLILPVFLLNSGIGEIFDKKFKESKKYLKDGFIMGVLYYLTSSAVFFPIAFFSGFYRLKLVGLLNYKFFQWIIDYLKNEFFGLLLASLIFGIVYYIFKKYKLWPVLLILFSITVTITGIFIFPLTIDPLLNKISPMENKSLELKIKELAKENGIDDIGVYQVEMSRETSSLNAYMTGIFSSRRIVIWDTVLHSLDDKEILSIVAHEIGHYNLNHIPKGASLEFILSLFTYGTAYIISAKISEKRGRDVKGAYGILYILVISTFIGMLLNPISLYYSRKAEIEADKFAIEATKDNLTNGILEIRFMESNLSPYDVDYWYKVLRYDHPTTKERIDLSNSYSY
ncbi:MAG: M48 family metalloprotease [Clostridiaceae bacterium]